MKTINYSELRGELKQNLDMVSDDGELLIVHRPQGRSVVVMSMEAYNAILETQHLLKSRNNRERLEKAVENINGRSGLLNKALIE